MKPYDIDLVYLWCDGNDADFAQQKQERMQQCGADAAINGDCRYVQIDELKYSLRSIEMYIPWIHHIYIVTNNQIPKWFRKNDKVTIIDHSEILPETALPCFNSQALECCLHKIPNLAEHFIYANDDCFVGRKLSPSFFFDKKQRPIVRLLLTCECKGQYYDTIRSAHNTIKQRFGVSYSQYEPHHNIDAYTKTILTGCEKEFPELFQHTIHQPFRNNTCLQRILFHMYALVKQQAVMKSANRSFFQRVMKKFRLAYIDSTVLFNKGPLELNNPCHPALFCINDTENSTDEDRARALRFLETRFPVKSPFEQDE